jgi:hypothetical protein
LIFTGISASSLATEIGINRSGVTHWLKHGGTLSSSRVHFWTLKSGDLSLLVRILSWASSSPFEMVYMAPNTLRVKDWLSPEWRSSLENPIQIGVVLPLAIYDLEKKVRILFRRKLGALAVNPQEIDILVEDGLSKWKTIPKDSFFSKTTIRIDPKIFDNCLSGNVSIEEYDWILGLGKAASAEGEPIPKSPLTWESFVINMARRGLGPEEVLFMIDNAKKEKA